MSLRKHGSSPSSSLSLPKLLPHLHNSTVWAANFAMKPVQWMSRRIRELQENGYPVDADVLRVLSPYRREHIHRLGDYLLDLKRRATPLDPTINFTFKSAA